MKFTAIYTRISVSSTQKSEGESLKSQLHRCQQRLSQMGVDPASILTFEDDGFSGGSLERPNLTAMLSMIRIGQVSCVVVTEQSRLSRDNYDSQQLFKLFNDHKVELVMLDFEMDPQTAMGKFLLQLRSALATHERDLVIERSKLAAHSRASRGLWSGTIPLGYRDVRYQPGRLEIDPETSMIVKMIYDAYLSLGSVRLVQQNLSDLHIYRPERRNHKGELMPQCDFPDSTLRKILTSRVYIGEREYKACNKHLDQSTLDVTDQYFVAPGQWEPIIERAQWERVQNRLEFNAIRRSSTAYIKHKPFILTGFLACGECGELLNTDSAKKNTYFYYCHQNKECDCSVRRWPAASLELPFLKALVELYRDLGITARACHLLKENERVERGETPQNIRMLENRVKKLKHEKAQLLLVIKENPELIKLAYHDQITRNQRELDQREHELSELRAELKRSTLSDDDLNALSDRLERGIEGVFKIDLYHLRQLFMYTIQRVEVTGRDEMKLILRDTPLLKLDLS